MTRAVLFLLGDAQMQRICLVHDEIRCTLAFGSVPKRAKFPKDFKAPDEIPSHRGFFW